MKRNIITLARVLSLALILGQTASLSHALLPQLSFDIGSNTKTLEYLESVKSDITSGKKIHLPALYKVYSTYSGVIHYINNLDMMVSGDDSQIISKIDDLYDQLEKDKTDKVINSLLELLDEKKYHIPEKPEIPGYRSFSDFRSAAEEILAGAERAIRSTGLITQRYYFAFAKLCFISPQYKDSKEKLERMKPTVSEFINSAEKKQKKHQAEQKEMENVAKKKDAEKKEIFKKYNVVSEVGIGTLLKNPYQFEGKVVLLKYACFKRMIERNLAIFSVVGGPDEILVSNIPSNFRDESKDLIVKVKGTTKAKNALGATITVPLVEFIAVFQ